LDKIQSLTGMMDLIDYKSDDHDISSKIFETEKKLIKIFTNYSLNEIRTPALENEQLFNRSVGGTSDIVNKELYTFLDKNDKSISLRPEGTAGVARSIIEKKLDSDSHRLWYMGPMWRYERPQKGRYRQFYQAGIELLGFSEGASEFEMISMIISINSELKINNAIIKINHLGNRDSKQEFCNALRDFLEPFKAKLDEIDLERLKKNPLRILDSKNSGTKKILEKAPQIKDFIPQDSIDLLENIKGAFPNNNIEIDYSMVRGLDYYSGFIFEAISDSLGAQNSYLGGGRYDQLFADLGGKTMPAIGMAIGIERIAEISGITKTRKNLVSFIILSNQIREKAYKIAHDLRAFNRDLTLEVQLSEGSLKSQLRRANKNNAKYVIIVGEDEIESNSVILKFLHDEDLDQKKLSIEEIGKFLSLI